MAQLPTPDVFTFGRLRHQLANSLGLPRTHTLGAGGRPYGSTVPSRAIRVYALPSGQRLVIGGTLAVPDPQRNGDRHPQGALT